MTREEILAFLNANGVSYLATVENGEPRVRGMAHYKADEQGILFHTGEGKDMTMQLRDNPKAELCVFDPKSGAQVRVRGTAKFIDDRAIKDEMVENRPYLKPIVEAVGYAGLVVFRLVNCQATVWTMATNLEPKTWVKL
jgi:pyridoxamine 5'-phosphate oxidase